MNRSKWKGPYIDLNIIKNIKLLKKKKLLPIISRNSTIIPNFIGLKFNVYKLEILYKNKLSLDFLNVLLSDP